MRKRHDDAVYGPVWLPQSRWPRIGEEMVLVRTPTGACTFADRGLASALFVSSGARIAVRGRGTWHQVHGVPFMASSTVWYLRYVPGRGGFGLGKWCLDSFDAAWQRETIWLEEMVPGQRFVYEG